MKLAKTSKMPCKSWSLNALDTCAGSIDPETGLLVPACQGCYATTGFYLMSTVRKPRTYNQKDWKRTDWVTDMVNAIGKDKHFRWFDSGDVYSLKLAWKIYQVMLNTPDCQHWLPTRMYKFPKFTKVFESMESLANVVVRYSSDSIRGEILTDMDHSSTIIEHADDLTTAIVCEAYSRGGKCANCRACWSKDVAVIAYPQHGRKMAKVNLTLVAA